MSTPPAARRVARAPTSYAGWAATAALSLIGVAAFLGNVPALGTGVLLLLGLTAALALRPAGGITLRRRIDRTSASLGERIEVQWDIEVASGIGPLVVHDRLPSDLALAAGANVRVFWKWLRPAYFTNRYVVDCSKRGTYELPPSEWEGRHVFDLRAARRGAGGAAHPLSVFPKVLPVRRLRAQGGIASSVHPAGARAVTGVATTDFKEIREYSAGDPVRSINWKASARHAGATAGRPLVNEFQREGRRAVWLFVDCSRHMMVGTNLNNPLESAIEAANALGHFFLTRGYHVGAHFSAMPDDLLYPDAGRRHYQTLSSRLAKLSPQGEHYDLLRAVHLVRQHLLALAPVCILVTRLDVQPGPDSPGPSLHPRLLQGVDMLGHLSPSRVRRMPVWVVGINGYRYPAERLPGTSFGVQIRHFETRPVVADLRRRLATVMEWDPSSEAFASALLRFTRGLKAG
jgi:uncharacterized protein (DUF58 family)